MKTLSVLASVALFLIVASPLEATVQQAQRVAEPEYSNVFFAINPSDSSLVALERRTFTFRTRGRLSGAETIAEVSGEKSPVRFPADGLPAFVVGVASRDKDPVSLVQFYVLKTEKGKRTLSLAKGTWVGSDTSGIAEKSNIKFTAVKYGDASFKVTPTAELPPGEYLVSTVGNQEDFLFGVDAKKSK